MNDSSERRSPAAAAEDALAAQRLAFLLKAAPLAVVEWDLDFRITRWNAEAERLFGWCADEMLGRHIDEHRFVYEGDRSAVARVMSGMLDGSRPRNVSLNRNYRKDGSVLECEWHNSSLLDSSGRLVGVLSLIIDTTARSRAERERRRELERE
jgi:PAS domain S-box-containing protein